MLKQKPKNNPVTVLSTIHDANELLKTKKDSHGNRIPKPEIVYEYTNNMSGVDLSDQYMAFHMSLRKSMKWWRKLFFHILNMILLNAYILNKKYGNNKLSHDDYMHHIASYLIETSMGNCTCLPQRTVRPTPMKMRLVEKHFIHKIPQDPLHETPPNPICKACNFSKNAIAEMGFEPIALPRCTTYHCSECLVALCVTPCFEIYHTVEDYRQHLLLKCLPDH